MRNPTKGDENKLRDRLCNSDLPGHGGRGTKLSSGCGKTRRRETWTSGGWGLRALTSWSEKNPGTSMPDLEIPHGVRPGLSQWRSSHALPSPLRPPEGLAERAFIYSHIHSHVNEKMLLPYQ